MQIKLGNFELIHSGIILTIEDNPVSIKLTDKIEGDYTFLINFIIDNEKKESITKYTTIDKFTLQIDFINFDGFMGGGNTDLISLGTLRYLPLYFNYRVFDLIGVGKTLMFNFYLGKEGQNGN